MIYETGIRLRMQHVKVEQLLRCFAELRPQAPMDSNVIVESTAQVERKRFATSSGNSKHVCPTYATAFSPGAEQVRKMHSHFLGVETCTKASP